MLAVWYSKSKFWNSCIQNLKQPILRVKPPTRDIDPSYSKLLWSKITITMNTVISIRLSQVPQYLHDSSFYLENAQEVDGQDNEMDETVPVPQQCMKRDVNVTSIVELRNLLLTLRFWGSERLPESILDFVLSEGANVEESSAVMKEFENELIDLVCLQKLQSGRYNYSRMCTAMEHGSLAIVRYLYEHGHEITYFSVVQTVQHGHIKCLRYAAEAGFNIDNSYLCTIAAGGGHIECIKFLLSRGCEKDREFCRAAIRNGRVECLRHLTENGCDTHNHSVAECFTSSENDVVAAGKLQCLQYFHEERGVALKYEFALIAAQCGEVICLQYLLEHGCSQSAELCEAAAEGGNLECLQYLHIIGCPWDAAACSAAARCGELECLQYLHEQDCPWDATACAAAAECGRLDCLQYLHEHGCAWDLTASQAAAQNEQFECSRYLHKHGCP